MPGTGWLGGRCLLMSDHVVVLVVASYPSRSAAATDFSAVLAVEHPSPLGHAAAAMVEKGADGELEVNQYHGTAEHPGWLGPLLGAALTVVAAPLGILFLASLSATGADWAAAGAIVGRLWYDIPKDQIRKMGNLLEDGQTALIVVAVDHRGEDISTLLSNATTMIVTDSTRIDFDAALA
jgi:uncharacterized membrane protein